MTIRSINPATEEIIFESAETSFDEINNIIIKTKKAQKEWFAKSKEDRINIIKAMKTKFIENKQKLIETINQECGFDLEETEATYLDVIDGFDHYITKYSEIKNKDFDMNEEIFPNTKSEIRFYPHGVVAQMGAWNYPLWQTMITAIPALLTGNSIIYKPSEKTTKIGVLIGKIINSTEGLPKYLFNTIIGGSKTGEYIVKQDIDAIVYTGNIETGNKIISMAGTKPTILELSGNDTAIVFSDCDIEQTVNGLVWGAFLHSGEVCDRVKRIYVMEDVANKIISGMITKVKEIKVTPLIRQEALDKVDKQVKTTVEQGGKILTGGKVIDCKGYYYEPTIIQITNNDVESVKNEIFGPVVTLCVVKSESEAIKLANGTKFGLGSSIWTTDYDKASKMANDCETGMVWINDSNLPLVCGEYFKGWKSTSIPNTMDRLHMFMRSKTIIAYNSKDKRDYWF